MNSYQKGVFAEWAVSAFLCFKGYKILARRYKTKFGEIDLVVMKRGVLVFVEVKTRSDIAAGLEAVTEKTQRRIINAAKVFLQQYGQEVDAVRFDVAAITNRAIVKHIRNAFYNSGF